MDEEKGRLRSALREIETMVASANREGAPVEPWVGQLVHELRAALADPAESRSGLAELIAADPAGLLAAQGGMAPGLRQALRALILSPGR